jgi:hypothetical protein
MSVCTSFHLWITASYNTLEGTVVNKLVERGYAITPADGKGLSISTGNGVSVVIALRVERMLGTSFSAQELHDDVMSIIVASGGRHYSVIVSEFTQESVWCASHDEVGLLLNTEAAMVKERPN